ncbi:VIT domain-containing protein, partial [Thermodesulfobacteriota bacterium]
MTLRPILITLTLFLAFTTHALADGFIVIDHPWVQSPQQPSPERIYPFAPLAVTYHRVGVNITDQIAVTKVDQVFHNPNPRRLEGVYLFPVPRGAQIDRFSMDINGKQVEAELLDAGKARKLYEDIVRKMQDPALLEYIGQGLFKVRIFPIEPRSDKRVLLTYTQILNSDGGIIEYVYPLNTEKFSSRLIETVAVDTVIETSRPLKTVYSPSHKVETIRQG